MTSKSRPPSRLARFAWSVLGINLLVIVWGAVVRATGSGAGCGSHWPLCNGEVVPLAPATETLIELFHRATSGVALLLVLALLVMVFRRRPKGHPARTAAVVSMVLIVIEALIGAGLVLFELVGSDDSLARAIYIAAHLTNTLLLVGALALTARFADASAPAEDSPAMRRDLSQDLLWTCLIATVLAAASGAIAALGDTLFPAEGLAQALAEDFSPSAHFLIRVRTLHPLIAIGAALAALILARRQLENPHRSRSAQRDARWLMLFVLLQVTGGVANVALLAPLWMQLLHLLMANFVWIALVLLGESITAEPERARQDPAVIPGGRARGQA